VTVGNALTGHGAGFIAALVGPWCIRRFDRPLHAPALDVSRSGLERATPDPPAPESGIRRSCRDAALPSAED
jgi:hypothetical protein